MRKHNLILVFLAVVFALAASAVQAQKVIDLQMDEGTGTAVGDSSGYGNHGEILDLGTAGTTAWVAGHNGSGVRMRDDVIKVPRSASLDITGYFHASMWVLPYGNGEWYDINGDGQVDIEFLASADWGFSKGGPGPSTGYGIYVPGNALPHGVIAFTNAGTKDFNGPGPNVADRLIAGQWNQIEIEFDGVQTYRLWVNSDLRFTGVLPAPDSVSISTRDLYIGHNQWTGGFLRGVVDEFDIVVPEPGSLMALGSGLVALAGLALRRRTR